jgi:hypothetical protein
VKSRLKRKIILVSNMLMAAKNANTDLPLLGFTAKLKGNADTLSYQPVK